MKLEMLDISKGEEARAWELFPGSPIQRILHNAQVREILTLRDRLEMAKPEEVLPIQSEIKARKNLLGLLHRNDVLPTK